MISINEAHELLKQHLKQESLIAHSIAVAKVMKALATELSQDENEWFLIGLLHDIDYDLTYEHPEKHGIIAMDILKLSGLKDYMMDAIRRHSGNETLVTTADKALWCADPVTGLITATALMTPEKQISVIKLNSLKKKFKNKKFAAGANREQIANCSDIGIELDDFLLLALEAMS